MNVLFRSICLFLLVAYLPFRLSAEDIYSDNIVIILDGSGSMGDTMKSRPGSSKMAIAKQALKKVSELVPNETKIGLLVFEKHSVPGQYQWNYPLGTLERANLAKAIDKVEAGGGTPLGEYIKVGADRLLEERKKQYGYGSYRLLIVTDGEATDYQLMEQYVPDVIARGITMDVIGVDMADMHTLSKKAHSYRRADDPESLRKALSEVISEISGNVSGNALADTDEAFEILKPIPDEMALNMIESLAKSGSDPIGSVQVSAEPPSDTGAAAAQPQNQPTAPSPGKPVQNTSGNCGSGLFVFLIIILAMISIFKKISNSRSRSGDDWKGRRHGR